MYVYPPEVVEFCPTKIAVQYNVAHVPSVRLKWILRTYARKSARDIFRQKTLYTFSFCLPG